MALGQTTTASHLDAVVQVPRDRLGTSIGAECEPGPGMLNDPKLDAQLLRMCNRLVEGKLPRQVNMQILPRETEIGRPLVAETQPREEGGRQAYRQ